MAGHRKGQETQEFRALTERIAGRRVRIRLEFIPELVAWMLMMGERYARTRKAAAENHKDTSDEMMAETVRQCDMYQNAIQQLINCCPDPFGFARWNEVTTRIAKEMGIVIGENLPPTIVDDARELVATHGE